MLPNGVVMTYSYDQASELSGITYKMGTTTLGDLSYTYDGDGRRATMGGSLAQVGLPGVLSSATYDAANELTEWDTTNVTYDANGNLTGDGVNTYAWDARNQLTSVTDVSSGTTLASFQYDAFGRRTENAAGDGVLYDGVNAVQELSGATPVVNRLTGGVDEFFGRTDSGGTTLPLTDALGSTIALTDSSGAIQTQYAYEPFGATTPTGATSSNWYQFTGRENDGTGLYYYRARYYSPRFQRFISEDPLGFAGGDSNFYSYTLNNPTNFTDPTGNQVGELALEGASVGSVAGPVGSAVGAAIGIGIGAFIDYEIYTHFMENADNLPDARPKSVPDNPPDTAHKKPPKKSPGCKSGEPLPPGWTPDWERMPSSRKGPGSGWWPPEGGEWHWHSPDPWHSKGHWDYNPWDDWNSPWQNIPHDPNSEPCP